MMNRELIYEVETRSLILFSDVEDNHSLVSFRIESEDLFWTLDDDKQEDFDSTTSVERRSRISKKRSKRHNKRLADLYLDSMEHSVTRLRAHKESFTERFCQLKALVRECRRRQLKQKNGAVAKKWVLNN